MLFSIFICKMFWGSIFRQFQTCGNNFRVFVATYFSVNYIKTRAKACTACFYNRVFAGKQSVFKECFCINMYENLLFELKLLHIVSLVHPSAVIAPNVKIGVGTVVMAGAVINPWTKIGQGCIINTCASVDHDCRIGDFVHVSVGAHVAGTVIIGDNTWVGAGATVSNNIEIVEDCMIGAGAVVIADITEHGTYVGVPAKKLKNNNVR